MTRFLSALLTLLLVPTVAAAITAGKPARDRDGLRRSVVRVENSLGELCTGVLVAPDIVLTAAHCIALPARYRVVILDNRFRPRSIDVISVEQYGNFSATTAPLEQRGTDLALIKLASEVPGDMKPVSLMKERVFEPETDLYLAGYGSTSYSNEKTARTLRIVTLKVVAVRQPPNDIVLAVDPTTRARIPGAGACRGDSGGPAFVATGEGYAVAGIASWSARAPLIRDSSPCGGITAVTPLAPYAGWIARSITRMSRSR